MKRIDVSWTICKNRIEILERENGEYKVNQNKSNWVKRCTGCNRKTRTVRCGKTLTKNINGFDVDKLIKQTTSYL